MYLSPELPVVLDLLNVPQVSECETQPSVYVFNTILQVQDIALRQQPNI